MPEHMLRIKDLKEAFPHAKFIYLYRNWLEVALSIENSFGKGASGSFNWYGFNSAKWHALMDHLLIHFPDIVRDPSKIREITDLFTRGVFEWIVC